MAQMLDGVLDGHLGRLLGRFPVFEVIPVLGIFHFDGRRAAVRMGSGRVPTDGQSRATHGDLVGAERSQA